MASMALTLLTLSAGVQEPVPGAAPDPKVVVDVERAYERGVRPSELASRVRSAERLVVRADRSPNAAVLVEVKAGSDLKTLAAAVDVDASHAAFLCGCAGSPVLELYDHGRQTDLITIHLHPNQATIRSQQWTSNAYLKRPAALVNWLALHGIELTDGGTKARGGRTRG